MASYGFSTFETFQTDNDNDHDTTLKYDQPEQSANAFISLDVRQLQSISTRDYTKLSKPFLPNKMNPTPAPLPNPSAFPLHKSIRQKLDTFYDTQKIPHIIFHGASGTGKITLVQEFIHKIYGGDKHRIKANVMTVNCSHGKGIKFIREELKFFAKTNIQTNSGVLFKTIVLINAHHLTIDAQSALRRCIELFSYNTRFFIILENKHKLLKPILSRFCEIYVPEYTDEQNNIINLHEHSLKTKTTPEVLIYNSISQQKPQIRECIQLHLGSILRDVRGVLTSTTGKTSIHAFTEIVDEFYYRGISTLDIIDWINEPENKTAFSRIELSNIMMCFYRIKPEFRCEKLLMFYMIHFIFCSQFKLPCV
jgi:DNA polymerase III delta prime subunit